MIPLSQEHKDVLKKAKKHNKNLQRIFKAILKRRESRRIYAFDNGELLGYYQG